MKLRIAATAATLALAWTCAHVEAPPGGAEDKEPPTLLVTRPDTLAVAPSWDAPAVLVFNERLSERGVEEAVNVSPRTSMVVVDHRGDEVRVRLRGGWEPGRIYHVTLLPGVQDLFGNRLTEPATLVFSTGPEIPETVVAGSVRDPLTGRPESGVRVEAIRSADSLVYSIPTDSAGAYRIARVPEGEYQVRAFRDLNRNRALDPFEPRGAATVTLAAGDSVRQALGVLMPDSTAPKLASAQARDSITFALTFDDHLDPAQELRATVQLVGAGGGSLTIPVERVSVGAPRDAPATARAQPGAAADTSSAEPLPSQALEVRIASHLRIQRGAKYLIRIPGVRNVVGLSAEVQAEVDVPVTEGAAQPPAPADTVAPDSVPPDTVPPADTARVRLFGIGNPATPEP